jgi:hypothetical protein
VSYLVNHADELKQVDASFAALVEPAQLRIGDSKP